MVACNEDGIFEPVLSFAQIESLGDAVSNISCAVVIIIKLNYPELWPISKPHPGLKPGFCS